MSDDPAAEISAALTEPALITPLVTLGHAADWARKILAEAGDDDVAALEYVIALDDALPRIARLMNLVPALVKAASPGAVVSERLVSAKAELDRQRAALAAERASIEAARDLERQAREVAAERDDLRERVQRLERAQAIERELPGLRARKNELEAAVSLAAAAEGDQAVRGLNEAAHRLRELSDAQRSLIAAENDDLVSAVTAAVEAAGRELGRRDELTAELADRERQAGELRAEQERHLPGLRARRQADEELLAGLAEAGLPERASAIERVRAELAEIERLIENAEALLKPLLRQHARAYEESRKIRGLTD